ncbi:MAG: PQQ-binding-like beta-propeller repeat protein [Pseudomonadales bacterium]|jgi:quinoprotein glucose dehydrogenase|nr:PQQ-binding-like beta-propeller repeat protein [Pseudomonadales bacterium]
MNRFAVISAVIALNFAAAPLYAQDADPVRGAQVFQTFCTRCHLPIEITARLNNDWSGHSGAELLQRVSATMPGETPGSLSTQQYRDVTAYVLTLNGMIEAGTVLAANAFDTLTLRASAARKPSGIEVPWLTLNGALDANRYAALDQIDASNVSRLEIAWRFPLSQFGPSPEGQNVTTPLMAGGRMFATAGVQRDVIGLDPTTGQLLWLWRAQEGERFDVAPRKGSGKGLAYWSDGKDEVIFTVTPGYYLVALNARTGLPMPQFGAAGWVDLQDGLRLGPGRDDLDIGLSFPPLVVNDVVIVGASHALATRPKAASNVKGDIRAYDAHSGKLLWTFHTIPDKNEFGAESWLGDSASYTGNAGVWAPMSADPELGLVYLPIEEPTGDYYGGDRPGNGLFGDSLVALNYRTGERRWYFQIIHHDIWDWDNPAAPILANLPDGRKVVVQLTKQAMAYVFDRATGEPLWPILETPVPQSDVPGEHSAPTQPIPTKPAPYDRQGFSVADLIDYTPELNAKARELVKPFRMSELFTPPSLAEAPDGTEGTLHLPHATGGANWQGGAFDPDTGLLYVPSRTALTVLGLVPGGTASSVAYIQGLRGGLDVDGLPIMTPPYGRITAIDLMSGEHRWWIPNADTPANILNHPALKGVDLPPRTGNQNQSGLLLTKTLLFSGEGPGGKPLLRAHDKATGDILAEIALPGSQTGTPMTFVYEGRQYIAVTTSNGRNGAELVVLRLPGR